MRGQPTIKGFNNQNIRYVGMVFKTSDEAIDFLSQFIRVYLTLDDKESRRLSHDETHIITELFGPQIPEAFRHDEIIGVNEVIMIKQEENENTMGQMWLVAPFEGYRIGDRGGERAGEVGGVVYCAVSDISAFMRYRFHKISRTPYDFWRGVQEGFGSELHYFRLKHRDTNIHTQTLNFSRRGF